MRIDFITLFPDMCRTVMETSMTGRAMEKGLVEIHFHQLRDFTENRQKQTEDRPFGGGPGKVMMAQPIADACRAVVREVEEVISGAANTVDAANASPAAGRKKNGTPIRPHIIFMTPAGKPFTQDDAKRLSKEDAILLVCGHYEGMDERVIEVFADEELSIGDYVLTGGELPALAVADSVIRLLPGVLKTEESIEEESFWDGLLEYPQYTRPAMWEGRKVPEVLLTGDHEKVQAWREEQKLERTRKRRPDLMNSADFD